MPGLHTAASKCPKAHTLFPAPFLLSLQGAGSGGVPDYFYTYPSRGLDLLFSGASHRLAKLVLHTNVPGHPDFNAYYKANFRWVQLCCIPGGWVGR